MPRKKAKSEHPHADTTGAALSLARRVFPGERELLLNDISNAMNCEKGHYSELESGKKNLTQEMLEKALVAHIGNPLGRMAIIYAAERSAEKKGIEQPVPLALQDPRRPALVEELYEVGQTSASWYDEGKVEAARALAERIASSRCEDSEYSRYRVAPTTHLCRILSHAGAYGSSINLLNKLLTEAKAGGDSEIEIYARHSIVATEFRLEGPSTWEWVVRRYKDIEDRLIKPLIVRKGTIEAYQAQNHNLRVQMMAIFTAELYGLVTAPTVERKAQIEILRVSADRIEDEKWLVGSDAVTARLRVEDDPEEALDSFERSIRKVRKPSPAFAWYVTKALAHLRLAEYERALSVAADLQKVASLGRQPHFVSQAAFLERYIQRRLPRRVIHLA